MNRLANAAGRKQPVRVLVQPAVAHLGEAKHPLDHAEHMLDLGAHFGLGAILHGKPAAIRCDNGPELTSYAFGEWCKANDIALRFIQPGKPDQNAFIERFNRTYRDEVLDAYLFDSIDEIREITDDWLRRYNEIRRHDSLGSLPPARYRERLLAAETSTLEVST